MKTKTRRYTPGVMLLWCVLLGCANEIPTPVEEVDLSEEDLAGDLSPNIDAQPDMSAPEWPDGVFGKPCSTKEDCMMAPGATCARLLGEQAPGICTVEHCTAGDCPVGGQCVTLGQTTACLPASPDFCDVRCGDPLQCALDLECLERGCCGSGACPSICGQMSYSDCEMSARCAASCCQL